MVVRTACLLGVIFAANGTLYAQRPPQMDGRLVDEITGTPLAGASISIVGMSGTARTDENGRFTWAPPPPLPFQMIVILAGGQVARPILIESLDATATIPVGAIADESVTVLGAAPSINTSAGAATTVLSATQIAGRNPENLMQALETVPGIAQVSEGHAAVPAVRGLARGRTLFLIDGGRVTSERRVGPSGGFLDPSAIEGIDVARGPGSVAYGSDALGGVVSVRTRRAEPGSPLTTKVTGTFGTGIPEARGTVELARGLSRGGILMQAHVRRADDYDSPSGAVFNSGWEDQGFLLNFTHTIAGGFFSAAWQSDFGRDVERPRNNSRVVRFYYPFENSHRLTSSYTVADVGGFSEIALTGFVGSHEQRTDQDRVATATTGRRVERADIAARDFHLKASAQRLWGASRLDFGLDVNGRFGLEALDIVQDFDLIGTLTSDTVNVSIENARRVDTGAYVEAETAIGTLVRVSAGVRADRVSTWNERGYFGDRSTAHTAGSGFAALTAGPFERVQLTAQIARGFRDPVLSDRYYRGPSGRGFITGNPDLDPETSVQLDLAARYALGPTQIGIFFYQYQITNLIERYQTDPDFFFFRNRGRARLRGVEVEARSDLGRGYSMEVAAQSARGRALDDDAPLDDISPATVSILVRKEFAARWYTQARAAWYDDDDRPGPSEVAAPGATVIDVGAGWRARRYFEVRALLRNLLDTEYYASPDPRFVLAPGRSLSVTAMVQF